VGDDDLGEDSGEGDVGANYFGEAVFIGWSLTGDKLPDV